MRPMTGVIRPCRHGLTGPVAAVPTVAIGSTARPLSNRAHRDPPSLNAWRKGRGAAIGGPNDHPGGRVGELKINVASPYYRAMIIILND